MRSTRRTSAGAGSAADSAADALSHPLFASGLSAASTGAFTHAYSGIAALIDEELQEEQQNASSSVKPSANAPAHSSNPLQPPSAASFTWTRPSAIRIARMRAEAAERGARGEETLTRDRHRATPYSTSSRPKTARGRVSSTNQINPDSNRDDDGDDSNMMQTDESKSTAAASSSSAESGYGAVRSHGKRRGASSTAANHGVASRLSVRTPAERAEEASAGETTMLLHMWKL
jgi:hypothetical protein